MKWTSEQAKAVEARDLNLLVSASAGSGKTAVLVERILKLVVDERIPLESFLIVTFTNAAAAEMRERIAKRLLSWEAHDAHAQAFIQQQIERVHLANVSTLHAFCGDVIKENFFLLNVDPNYKIATQQVLTLKRQEALDKILDQAYAMPTQGFENVISAYASHKSDEGIRSLILKVYDFSRAHPYPDQWLEACAKAYRPQADEEEGWLWLQGIKDQTRLLLKALKSQLEEAHQLCHEPAGPLTYASTLEEDLGGFDQALETGPSASHATWRNSLQGITFGRLKALRKDEKESVDPVLQDRVKAMRNKVKKAYKNWYEAYYMLPLHVYLEDLQTMSEPIGELVKLVNHFAKAYDALKLSDNLLDFNDLEQLAIQALNHPDCAMMYRNRFAYVFVDEYQDSNRVQEEIVSLIKREDNLFLVGDVKQSIYRFRMAEPGLFLEKFNSYPKQKQSLRVDLNENFRTHPDILAGVNKVFDVLMTQDFGGLSYEKESRLVAGRTDFEGRAKPRLTLLYDDETLEGDDKFDLEIRLIKQRIEALQEERIFDTHLKQSRKITLGDMVILMRSVKGKAKLIRDKMAQWGIPVMVDEEDSYFEIVEVATLIDCLRLVDNIRQDIPLMGVLRSPVGGLTDQDLAEIRTLEAPSFYASMVAYQATGGHEVLVAKLKRFEDLMLQLRRRKHQAVSDFIHYLLEVTGYKKFVLALEEGEKRCLHFDVLIEKAEAFESERQSGLHHFVDYLDQMREAKVAYGGKTAHLGNTQAVRIMSIHKSKGLEFPVVILASLGKRFNMMDLNSKVVMHQAMGLTTKLIDPQKHLIRETLPLSYMKALIKDETLQEEARILYVAMTRAIYHLELTGVVSQVDHQLEKWLTPPDPYSLRHENSYLNWLMPILIEAGEANHWLRQMERETSETKDLHWTFEAMHANQLKQTRALSTTEQVAHFKETLDQTKPLAWQSHLLVERVLPKKLSVSELKQAAMKAHYTPKMTQVSHAFEPTSEGIKRGNAYHKVMEWMPIDQTPSLVVVQSLMDKDLLTQDQVNLLEIDRLEALRTSPLFIRMVNAKKIWREQAFVFEKSFDGGEKALIQGIIDAMFLEEDGLIIVDYKSDQVSHPQALIDAYQVQLSLYEEAMQAMLDIKVKGKYIYSIALNQWIEV